MRRLLIGAAALEIVIGLLVAGMAGGAAMSGSTALTVAKVDQAHFTATPGGVIFLLAIGNDGRAGLAGSRGDALHLIGVNPALGQATMLNIPRDTYVDIPGRGRGRINEAYEQGGAALQAQAVSALTGIPISYTFTTSFDGLVGMVDELGGVDVDVPYPMNDSFSGAVFSPGRVHMDGESALAFSRNRHLLDGDITRTYDQGLLILAALAKLRADTSPTATVRALSVLLRHTRTEGIGVGDLYRLGTLGLGLDPAKVRQVALPVTDATVGGAQVLFVTPPAQDLFADMRDDAVLQSH